MASPRELIHRLQTSLPWRAWQRYGHARGGVLAGGIAYIAFFSLFPALAVGFTVFGVILGNDSDLQARVIDAVNDGIGTTIITPPRGSGGIVSIDSLTGSNELTIAGILGLVGFLFTGLGWLDAMREGIRAMFGQPPLEGNVVLVKLRDLLVLVSIGIVVLASAIGGIAVSGTTGALLRWVGLDGSLPGRLVLGAASTLLLLGVDVLVFMVIFRLLSGVPVARHDFWDAALFGGIGLGVLKLFAGLLLNILGNNKFLATAGVLLGLLVWLNLVTRLTLIAAAWGATVAIDRGHLGEPMLGGPESTVPVQRAAAGSIRSGKAAVPAIAASARSGVSARPGASTRPASAASAGGVPAPAVPFTPVVSPRSADRISVVAGAVLGMAGMVAVRTATGAVRSVVDSVRRPPSS